MPTSAPLSLVLGFANDDDGGTHGATGTSQQNAFGPAIPRSNWRRTLSLLRPHIHARARPLAGRPMTSNEAARHADPGEALEEDIDNPWGPEDGTFFDDDSAYQDGLGGRSSSDSDSEQDPREREAGGKAPSPPQLPPYTQHGFTPGWTTAITTWWEDAPLASSSSSVRTLVAGTVLPIRRGFDASQSGAPRAGLQGAGDVLQKRSSVSSLRRARANESSLSSAQSSAMGNPLLSRVVVDAAAAAAAAAALTDTKGLESRKTRRKITVLGGTPGYRVALGFQDGSVWIMKSDLHEPARHQGAIVAPGNGEADVGLLSPTQLRSHGAASPRRPLSGSSTPGQGRLRSISATKQQQQQHQQFQQARVPSISGFAPEPPSASELTSQGVVVMASPPSFSQDTDAHSAADSSAASASTAPMEKKGSGGGTAAKGGRHFMSSIWGAAGGVSAGSPAAPDKGKDASASASMPSAEALLEAQYHAGEHQSDLISGAVGRLFAGTSTEDRHHHHQHHGHPPPSPHADTDSDVNDSQQRKKKPAPPSGRAGRLHARSQALAVNSLCLPLPSGLQTPNTRASPLSAHTPLSDWDSAGSWNTSPARPQTIITCADDDEDEEQGLQDAPVDGTVDPYELKYLSPVVQLSGSDSSPVVVIKLVESEARSSLAVLQQDGALSVWSMDDGSQQGRLDLNRSSAYPPEIKVVADLPTSDSTSFLQSMPAHLASIAARRLHSNSPAPGAAGSHAGSRIGSRRGSHSNGVRSTQASKDQCRLLQVQFEGMQVFLQSNKPYGVLKDCLRRLLVVVEFEPTLRVMEAIELPPESRSSCAIPYPGDQGVRLLALGADGKLLLRCWTPVDSQGSKSGINGQDARVEQNGSGTGANTPQQSQQKHQAPTEWKEMQRLRIDAGESMSDAEGIEACGLLLLAWCQDTLAVFAECDGKFQQIERRAFNGIRTARLSGGERCVQVQTQKGVLGAHLTQSGFAQSAPFPLPSDAFCADATLDLLGNLHGIFPAEDETVGLKIVTINAIASLPQEIFAQRRSAFGRVRPLVPLSLEKVLLPCSRGALDAARFDAVAAGSEETKQGMVGTELCVLQIVLQPRTQAKLLVGGTLCGDILIWDTQSLQLLAMLSQFDSSVAHIFLLDSRPSRGRLNECLACVAADGTVAILQLDSYKLRLLIPSRGAPLDRLAMREDELLLMYADGNARIWDMRSQELRHSMPLSKAIATLEDGGAPWAQYETTSVPAPRVSTGVLSHLPLPPHASTNMLQADMRKVIEAAAKTVAPKRSAKDEVGIDDRSDKAQLQWPKCSIDLPPAQKALSILRPFLQALWPRSRQMQNKQLFTQYISLSQSAISTLGSCASSRMSWTGITASQADPSLYTSHQIVLHAILRVLSHIDELSDDAFRALAALLSPATLHHGSLVLPQLARFFFDANREVAHSARSLFEAALTHLSDESIAALVDLHCAAAQGGTIPMSTEVLVLTGSIACQRYKSLNPAVLKEISVTVESFLNDDAHPERQAIAIELCQQGFNIWQNYVDAMELVRVIFSVATATLDTGESTGLAELRTSARQATLQIAHDNTPLFMTTLSHDILQARSPAHCSATMRLVAFMVRRKPLLLHPNLPRLAEAVVKSLDPNATTMRRDLVVQAATVMISELVHSYPSIAFHGTLQRLAVGTHEGAVITYDLKTATRLYVIEGHRRPVSACSYSPDGRRLITVSLEEGRVLVWKVGSSLASVFTPGSLPRQGGTDRSGAYKAIEFHVAELPPEEEMFRAIRCDWVGDHSSARVQVGETSLSFDAM